MKIRYAAAAFLTSLAIVATTVSTASASADGGSVLDPTRGAAAWFKHDGDVIWSRDLKADGHSAVVRVYVPSAGIAQNLWNSNGSGSTRSQIYGEAIPEGSVVYYQACIGEYGTKEIIACTPGWASAVA